MIVGITGKIASGKSTLAKEIQKNPEIFLDYLKKQKSPPTPLFLKGGLGRDFLENNFSIIEVDSLGHELLEKKEIQKKLINIFGDEIIEKNVGAKQCFRPQVDRKILRQKTLSSPAQLEKLEAVLHPEMKKILVRKITNNKNIIVVCALPKTFLLNNFFTQKIELEIEKNEAWKRAQQRNKNLTKKEFEVLWHRQEKEY